MHGGVLDAQHIYCAGDILSLGPTYCKVQSEGYTYKKITSDTIEQDGRRGACLFYAATLPSRPYVHSRIVLQPAASLDHTWSNLSGESMCSATLLLLENHVTNSHVL